MEQMFGGAVLDFTCFGKASYEKPSRQLKKVKGILWQKGYGNKA